MSGTEKNTQWEIVQSSHGDADDTVIKLDGVTIPFVRSYRIHHEAGELAELEIRVLPSHLKIGTLGKVVRRTERWYTRAWQNLRSRVATWRALRDPARWHAGE